jgi:endonuclease/exonuclease/phosphatase family metal-dependent hydrolase
MNVVRFLAQSQPDILCLQEVAHSPEGESYFFDNIAEIQKEMDYPHVFLSPTFGMKLGALPIKSGNAILSRVPLEEIATVFTIGDYAEVEKDGLDNIGRNFQHALVRHDGKSTHIINHHGYWFPGAKTGNDETMRQMTMIADYIKKLEGPVIFAGDLNLLPESPSLQRLNTEMENLCITHKVKTTRNFTSYNAVQVCDYIFTRGIRTNSFKVHDDVVSDHSMLELDFA